MAGEVFERVGSVAGLWRYPVKSMLGEPVDESAVTEAGLVGDRAFALLDIETGKIASAKSPRVWPNLLDFAASFVAPPSLDRPLPPVRIELPSGKAVHTDDPAVDDVLSEATGRRVRLVSSNPSGATFEMYVPPVEGADPEGGDLYRDVPNDIFGTGSLYDAAPVHVVTAVTLDRLGELSAEGPVDVRRFRPNILVALDDDTPRFAENDWVKRAATFGEVAVRITMPTLRCVMTTRPQRDLPQDLGVLRTAAAHNRLEVLGLGRFPCVGAYGLVVRPGTVHGGDAVGIEVLADQLERAPGAAL